MTPDGRKKLIGFLQGAIFTLGCVVIMIVVFLAARGLWNVIGE